MLSLRCLCVLLAIDEIYLTQRQCQITTEMTWQCLSWLSEDERRPQAECVADDRRFRTLLWHTWTCVFPPIELLTSQTSVQLSTSCNDIYKQMANINSVRLKAVVHRHDQNRSDPTEHLWTVYLQLPCQLQRPRRIAISGGYGERQPITGVWGRSPQRGQAAELWSRRKSP